MSDFKILVVEDDRPVANLITTTLKIHDYTGISASSGKEAISLCASHNPDLILLDLGLPDMDGIDVIRTIREWSSVMIIIISARSEDSDKILALDSGADDYLTKPFGVMELLSRIRALMRRTSDSGSTAEELLESDGISLNTARHLVTVHDTEIILTGKEFDLLAMLMRNQGIVLTRERILQTVWGYDYAGESRTVDVHIRTLRAKLGEAGNVIETVRGVGYRFESTAHEDTAE